MTDLTNTALTDAELDLVGGGDGNYKGCPLGSTAGGPPGMYPSYTTCATQSFVSAVAQGILAGAHAAAGRPA
jgi:hypothetical protein